MAISLKRRNKGLFNNYVTQKFPFFDTPTPPTPLPSPSRFITNGHKTPPLRYVTPDTDTSLYHLFLFFEVEKKSQRYASTYGTSTHVFKQQNQIVRFK